MQSIVFYAASPNREFVLFSVLHPQSLYYMAASNIINIMCGCDIWDIISFSLHYSGLIRFGYNFIAYAGDWLTMIDSALLPLIFLWLRLLGFSARKNRFQYEVNLNRKEYFAVEKHKVRVG